MAKLPRVLQKILGLNADVSQVGIFGSLAAGDPQTSRDLTLIQSLSKFTDGWYGAVLGQNNPALQDRNALDFLMTSQLAYLFQSGVAEWESNTVYYTGSYCTESGVLYVSIQDTNSGNDPVSSPTWWIPYDTTRAGTVVPFAGITTPFGYLLCDGSAISRTTYATLFAALAVQVTGTTSNGSPIISSMSSTTNLVVGMPISGTNIPAGATILSIDSSSQIHISTNCTANASGVAIKILPWGVGDGSTTFNLPDLRGRTIAGRDDMGGSAAGRLTTAGSVVQGVRIGATGGAQNVTLDTTMIPSHTHSYSGTTSGQSASHTHGGVAVAYSPNGNHGDDPAGPWLAQPGTSAAASNDHTHTYSGTTAGTGGSQAHLNVQPTAVMNFMVKY